MKNQLFEEVLNDLQQEWESEKVKDEKRASLAKFYKRLLSKLENSRTYQFSVEPSTIFRNENFMIKPLMENHQGKCFKLELSALYQNIIKQIIEENPQLEFSHCIDELFMYCYHKRYEENDRSIRYKLFINCCYGILSSNKFDVRLSENVTNTMTSKIKAIVNIFRPYTLAMDIDEIIVSKRKFDDDLKSIFPNFEIVKFENINDAIESLPRFAKYRINSNFGNEHFNEKFHRSFS